MNLVKILKLYTVGVFCAFMSVIVHNSSLAQSSLPTCVPPPTGLVGWWSGDGNPNDIVGNNNGTLQNGATFVPGIVAQAFSFDGENDAIVVPDALDLNPIQQLTIEAWVFPTANSGSPSDVVGIIVNKESEAGSPTQYEIGRRNEIGCGIPTGNFAFALGGLSGLPSECEGWVDGNAFRSIPGAISG